MVHFSTLLLTPIDMYLCNTHQYLIGRSIQVVDDSVINSDYISPLLALAVTGMFLCTWETQLYSLNA